MPKLEKNYQFKTQLLQVHKKDIRDLSVEPKKTDFVFDDDVQIIVKDLDIDQVIMTAVRDFEDYLFTSMNVCVSVKLAQSKKAKTLTICLNQDLGKASGYMGYRIKTTSKAILLEGYDPRGIAQGLYYLEDMMNYIHAPYISADTIERKALFSPRIVQSPFGMFSYPDEAFMLMAHRGEDAIDLWLKDPYTDKMGNPIDVNLIAQRAKKYGVDVYVEIYAPNEMHPTDDGAQEYYDKLYGEIFDVCPIIKGIMVEGECSNFNSRDPKVGLAPHSKNYIDNIPTGKVSPGWWPCSDYPEWITMIRDAVRKKSDTCEVIFCTYNWGYAPEEDRIKLLKAIPTDISICATFDMFEQYKVGNIVENVWDYSLSFVGPSKYFVSEAKVAKERGIRLLSITNTAGRTWDFGVVPYEPMPEQWIKRYKALQKAKADYNLAGFYESIHYGFHPSFIGDLAKQAFFTPIESLDKTLDKILARDFGEKNVPTIRRATAYLSKAIEYYIPTNEDQYGAFRIGPSYPLWSSQFNGLPSPIPDQGRIPSKKHAMFGNRIYFGEYTQDLDGNNSLSGVRIRQEIKSLESMLQLAYNCYWTLLTIPEPNENLQKFMLLVRFIKNTIITGLNVKKHFIIKQKLSIANTRELADEYIAQLISLLKGEKENVEDTINIVKYDSRLGWEPSMEYTCDQKSLEWKLRQLEYELNVKIPKYKKANSLIDQF